MRLRLSLSDPQKFQSYLGSQKIWEESEATLRQIVQSKKTDYFEAPGEAAFYGPKLDFMAKDSLGREWQLATIQLDLNMPERFNLACVNEKSQEERIAMIHAAIMGSIERYVSILIEHFNGAFPVWLAPVQAVVIPISDKVLDYAKAVNQRLQGVALRAGLDDRNETMQAKIRDAQLQKIPYMIIIGEKERDHAQNQSRTGIGVGGGEFSLRLRDGRNLGRVSLTEFVNKTKNFILTRSLDLW